MATIHVLAVCGSGTVTSSMVAGKIRDRLGEQGYRVMTEEARPTEAIHLASSGRFDLMVHTSPIPPGDYTIPVIDAFPCISMTGEEEFFDKVLACLSEKGKLPY